MSQPVGTVEGDEIHVGGDARQRFFDSRGYGEPRGGNEVALAPVEAAHLLSRGDLSSVDAMSFREFLGQDEDLVVRFRVYADLRSRGFYLSPTRWVDADSDVDFVVYERGQKPFDGERRYSVRVIGERTSLPVSDLSEGVLAVVDEESEVTYFEVGSPELGETRDPVSTAGSVAGEVLSDRVVLWNAPLSLYERSFYGQPIGGRDADPSTLALSLVEATYLAECGVIALDPALLEKRGRETDGERFDRRLGVYTTLRERGLVPKTGFKFGADFRVYGGVESVEELGHSEHLVRVVPPNYALSPRELSLDVRLAGGVRKRMVFAPYGASSDTNEWRAVRRLTP
ncbi:tRNA-intron lyase [Natronorarus salvus]|uniref:tRNA-intron lyase n=1 Tax=Natronorarus salvus TaxID=3117733 RepID=UPI002F26DDE9